MDGGADATRGLPMLPPPAPTFRAPTRDSVLLQMGTRPSSFTTEEDLSFMDAEVRTATMLQYDISGTLYFFHLFDTGHHGLCVCF